MEGRRERRRGKGKKERKRKEGWKRKRREREGREGRRKGKSEGIHVLHVAIFIHAIHNANKSHQNEAGSRLFNEAPGISL